MRRLRVRLAACGVSVRSSRLPRRSMPRNTASSTMPAWSGQAISADTGRQTTSTVVPVSAAALLVRPGLMDRQGRRRSRWHLLLVPEQFAAKARDLGTTAYPPWTLAVETDDPRDRAQRRHW